MPKFKRLKKVIKKKATAEKQASAHPKEFLEKMYEPSIKKLKGVAF